MHLNMSYNDIRSLPIKYRRWFIDRLVKHFKVKQSIYDSERSVSKQSNASDNSAIDMSKVEKFFSSKF